MERFAFSQPDMAHAMEKLIFGIYANNIPLPWLYFGMVALVMQQKGLSEALSLWIPQNLISTPI